MSRARRAALAPLGLALLLVTGACSRLHRAPSPETVREREWTQTLADARAASEGGRHVDADRQLAAFASRYPGTPEATETLYWRGLYRLDAANRTHTAADALQLLDAYLAARPADTLGYPFRPEAMVLRRIAAQTDQLGRALASARSDAAAAARANAPAPARDPSTADVAAKDAEIERLKEELRKANDELDRIKTRLQRRRP